MATGVRCGVPGVRCAVQLQISKAGCGYGTHAHTVLGMSAPEDCDPPGAMRGAFRALLRPALSCLPAVVRLPPLSVLQVRQERLKAPQAICAAGERRGTA